VVFEKYGFNHIKNVEKLMKLMVDCINKDTAIQVANSLLKNEGKNVSLMNIEVSEKDNQFIIIYTLKDTLSLGGGAEIVIDKSDCEIITIKLYQ